MILLIVVFCINVFCEEDSICSEIGGFVVKDKCYKFFSSEKNNNWNPSRFFCQSDFHPSSDLAVITSQEEHDLIVEHMTDKMKNRRFWLGFLPRKYKGLKVDYPCTPQLIDSTYVDYSNWADDIQGGGNKYLDGIYCVKLSRDSDGKLSWKPFECDGKNHARPFCSLDLSKPELLNPDTENTYDPIEVVDAKTSRDAETCEEETEEEDEYQKRKTEIESEIEEIRKNFERKVHELELLEEKYLSERYIFQIGFYECGTRTLTRFFKANGVDTCVWENGRLAATMYENYQQNRELLEGISNGCMFIGDMEYSPKIQAYRQFFKVLDSQYPKSRFILNVQNKENWLSRRTNDQSYINFVTSSYLGLSSEEEITEFWSKQFDDHIEKVKEHFEGRPDKLLVFDNERDDGSNLVDFFKDWYPELRAEYWGEEEKFVIH